MRWTNTITLQCINMANAQELVATDLAKLDIVSVSETMQVGVDVVVVVDAAVLCRALQI